MVCSPCLQYNHTVPGCAYYPEKQPAKPLALPNIEKLCILYVRGNDDKYCMLSANRACTILVKGTASKDYNVKLVKIDAMLNAFFGMENFRQLVLIFSLRNGVANVEIQGESDELEEVEKLEEARA